jgi:histidine triad (HIT) family protein
MNDCIFCKIANKEIPANIVYEDDKTIAFLDIHPYNQGHTLVIPKVHSNNFFETTNENLSNLSAVTKKVGAAVEKATNAEGIQIRINTHEAGGQDVFHVHFHIVPKYFNDSEKSHPASYAGNEKEETAEKIKKELS